MERFVNLAKHQVVNNAAKILLHVRYVKLENLFMEILVKFVTITVQYAQLDKL